MSATDELRRLLDERGVEWSTNKTLTDSWTKWNVGKLRCTATEINGAFAFTVGNCTPELAIAATLGGGECEDVGQAAVFKCSECGWYSPVFTFGDGMPQFCPSCGAKVKAVKR